MNRWTWMWLATATLSGCGARWVSPAEDAAVTPGDVVAATSDVVTTSEVAVTRPIAPDAGACLAVGVRCRGATPGCCVGFCDYQPYGYGPGVCVTPQPDGEYCDEDRQCQSGHCVDELCRASACVAMSERCERDEACCGGFCTASALSYAPGRCAVAQPAGAPCEGPRWCVSGRCVDSVCLP